VASGGADIGALGKLGIGNAAILLQQPQQAPIDAVEIGHGGIIFH
jgi:hypothetical protein